MTGPRDELPRRPEEDLPVTERVRPTHRPVHGKAGLTGVQLEHRQARVTQDLRGPHRIRRVTDA